MSRRDAAAQEQRHSTGAMPPKEGAVKNYATGLAYPSPGIRFQSPVTDTLSSPETRNGIGSAPLPCELSRVVKRPRSVALSSFSGEA